MRPRVSLIALAGALGKVTVTLTDMASRYGLTTDQITAKTGVTGLRRLASDESLVELGADVARRVLAAHGVGLDQVRGVFGSSNPTAETLLPTFTALVANAVGLRNVIVDHVGVGCCGGLQAMRNACNQLIVDALAGRVSFYLLVVGDQTSRILDPQRKQTGTLFSEGVSVALLTNAPGVRHGYLVEAIGTKSLLGEALQSLRLRNPYAGDVHPLEMEGAKVFEFGEHIFEHFLDLVGNDIPQNCYIVPHQSNLRMLEAMTRVAGLSPDQVYVDGTRTIGNTSPAAALLGLEDALRRGLVKAPVPVLLGAFGAELQVGAARLRSLGDPQRMLVA
ncbi:MAG TPA: 3-oxoacyl-[acyl-carrier-protein] synthase III C-terminal domain-containing protein [Candidatus Xenobia bacterium]|jgi:3-oxoacyl-[acyl-carrier-protein] synthase-3